MISDLENIVVSYLDPDSYKILQQYNPKKFNKLHEIQKSYEKIIPYIIRDNIVKTGITLKSEMISLFDRVNNITSATRNKITSLIDVWSTSRINDIVSEYEKVGIEYKCQFSTLYPMPMLSVTRKYNDKNYTDIISLRCDILTNYNQYVDTKNRYSLFKKIDHIYELLQNNDIVGIKQYVNDYKESITDDIEHKIINTLNEDNFIEASKHVDSIINSTAYFTFGIIDIEGMLAKTEMYNNTKLFQFQDEILIIVSEFCDLSKDAIMLINDVMITIHHFYKIYDDYIKIVS